MEERARRPKRPVKCPPPNKTKNKVPKYNNHKTRQTDGDGDGDDAQKEEKKEKGWYSN